MFTTLFGRVVAYMHARETERLLHSLGDASLNDIGIPRSDIANHVASARIERLRAAAMPSPVKAARNLPPLARAA